MKNAARHAKNDTPPKLPEGAVGATRWIGLNVNFDQLGEDIKSIDYKIRLLDEAEGDVTLSRADRSAVARKRAALTKARAKALDACAKARRILDRALSL